MARKLKTFQTSVGFYDLAVAAPSMKAALDAWGAGSNLFHQGIAKETDDPDVVAATMSNPGVVLKRPAGSSGRFAEQSGLPSNVGSSEDRPRRERRHAKPSKRPSPKISDRNAQKAATAFEKEQKRREAGRRREEAIAAKERARREKAASKAAVLDKAEREHANKTAAFQAEVEALEDRKQAEAKRWEKQRERLQAAVRRARD
jgi:colicin import membrane protein